MKIGKGTIAFCSAGYLGLITSDKQSEVTYGDGSKGIAWTGIHISPPRMGDPWSSRDPRPVGSTKDIIDADNREMRPPTQAELEQYGKPMPCVFGNEKNLCERRRLVAISPVHARKYCDEYGNWWSQCETSAEYRRIQEEQDEYHKRFKEATGR